MNSAVTVIVPSYNNSETLRTTLLGVLAQQFKGEVEILVIDDFSSDKSAEICNSLGLKVFLNERNLGLAESLNRGISLSKTDVVITLHSDSTPLSEHWLSQLVAQLDGESVAATCSLQHSPKIEQMGFTLWEKFLWGKVLPHHALNNKADAYKKPLLEKIGMFDARRFRTAGEDEDLGLRLRLSGWTIIGTSAEIRHDHKFAHSRSRTVFGNLLKKEYTFGRAGGALRRKFPTHPLGAFVYPDQKSFLSDGMVRVSICVGCFIPYLQWISIPALTIISLIGIRTVAKRTHLRLSILAYPLFNAIRFWSYSLGYVHGLVSGKQR